MATLRELLLSIKVQVDKNAVKQTDVAFDQAAKSAAVFETRATSALAPLKKIAQQLSTNTKLAEKFSQAMLPAGALPNRPEAPSSRNARLAADALGMAGTPTHPAPPRPGGNPMAAPDISKFYDTRSGPAKALDFFKAKASSAMASAGAAAERFNARFDKIAGSIFNARTAMAGFAVVVAGTAVGRFLNDVIEAGGALHDMSDRTRVSVETLQVWRAIATDAGVDAGSLEGVFRKLTKSMAAAARGAKLPEQSFKDLKVSVKNVDGSLRPIEDVLIDTGAALAAMDDDAKATAIATQLLGPAGMGLVPAFNKGAAAIRQLSAEMKENVALNAAEAAQLDDVGDALHRAALKWEALKTRLVVSLLPVLEAVSTRFEAVSKWLLRMAKETSAIQAILTMFAGLGLTRVITMLGAWVARVGGARAAMALLGSGLRTAAIAAAEFIVPMLVIEDFLTFLAGGKSVFGRAFEEIFGSGGAKQKRAELMAFFDRVENVVTNQIVPALAAVKPILEGIGTIVGSVVLGALNLVGMALSDNKDKTKELAEAFERNMAPAVGKVADMIAAIGRAILQIPGMSGAGFAIGGAADDLRKTMAEMANSGKNIGVRGSFDDRISEYGSTQAQRALRGYVPSDTDPRAMSPERPPSPIPSSPIPPPGYSAGPAQRGQVTLNDQRRIEILMGGLTPASAARTLSERVDAVLTKDRRQTLSALSG